MIPLKVLNHTIAYLRGRKQHTIANRVADLATEVQDLRVAVAQAEFLMDQLILQDAVRLPFPRWNEVRGLVRKVQGLPELPAA